jgi:hypothetical protein
LDRIIAALKAESQYVQHFDEEDVEGIKKVRSLGRRACRELGWKIMTVLLCERRLRPLGRS